MSHISPTMDLVSISHLMMDPIMIKQSLVQIMTYHKFRNSSLSLTVSVKL